MLIVGAIKPSTRIGFAASCSSRSACGNERFPLFVAIGRSAIGSGATGTGSALGIGTIRIASTATPNGEKKRACHREKTEPIHNRESYPISNESGLQRGE